MIGKGWTGKVSLALTMIGIVLILYGSAHAIGINRIIGSNVVAGDGLEMGTDGKDTLHVLPGFPLSIDNDSVKMADDVITKSLFADEDWGDGSIASNEFTLDADVVGDNEIDYSAVTLDDFDYQTAWRVFYSNTDGDMTELALGANGTYLKSNGATSAPTFETPGGSGDITDVWNCATGDCNTPTIGESEYLIGGAVDGSTDPYISLPQGADVSSVTGEGRISWDTDGDQLFVGDGAAVNWILSEEDIDASSELLAIMDDETGTGVLVFGTSPTFTTGITVPDNSISDEELDEGATFTWTGTHGFTGATVNLGTGAVDAAAEISADVIEESHLKVTGGAAVDEDIFTYESTTGDFEWHTPAELGMATSSAIGDTADVVRGEISDSIQIDRFLPPTDPSIDRNMDQGIELYYPVTKDNYDWTCEYTATGADQKDTVCVFSSRMPMGVDANGIDSICFNAYTTGSAVGDASIEVMVYKRTTDGGAATAIDSLDEFNTTAAWAHQSITGFDTDAAAGNWLKVSFIINCDNADTVWHDQIYVWYTGK